MCNTLRKKRVSTKVHKYRSIVRDTRMIPPREKGRRKKKKNWLGRNPEGTENLGRVEKGKE